MDIKNPQENISPKKPADKQFVFIAILMVLVVTNIASAYFLTDQNKKIKNEADTLAVNLEKQLIKNAQLGKNIEQEAKLEDVLEPEQTEPDEIEPSGMPTEEVVELQEGEISVAWNEWPVVISASRFFDYGSTYNLIEKLNKDNSYSQLEFQSFVEQHKIYKAGEIENGPYSGKNVFIITFRPEGPSFRDTMYRVIKDEDKLILLSKYSDRTWGIYDDLFAANDKLIIKNLETKNDIAIPNKSIALVKSAEEPLIMFNTFENLEKILEYGEGEYLYKDEKNCYLAKAPDGTIRNYYFKLDFLQKNSYTGTTPNTWDISWDDGDKNIHEYTFRGANTCGAGACYNYIIDLKADDLKKIGSAGGKYDIYETIDRESELLKDFFKEVSGYNGRGKSLDYDEYLEEKPLAYWQDPFGNFLELRNAAYQPQAECGKPVIYLYPEKETDVLVQVEPSGGLTLSEPAYDKGWKVKARPDGAIYNYDDKQTYPYLFWEGLGLNYNRPEKGFVVAKEDVKTFLKEKLAQLGLIKTEYDEFLEFWYPQMQASPYYFITFVPQAEFNKLAPLQVFPRPDTVIRVFMDFEGLREYAEVEEQILETPERVGFTVVEWGGALHK